MASALQPQPTATPVQQVNLEANELDNVAVTSAHLLTRLRIQADPAEAVAINPVNPVAYPAGEGSPFIIAANVWQHEDGRTAAIIGEPGMVTDNAAGVMTQIGASDLLDLYQARGKKCFEKLQGSWASVILDPHHDRVLLACDRMGRQPLYYRIGRNSVLIGSSLARLRGYAGAAGLNVQALYDYLYFHMVPAPDAVVERFKKLGAGQMLELTPEGNELSRYWTPEFNEKKASGAMASTQAELRSRLKTAVRRCTYGYKAPTENAANSGKHVKVGAFLSGGLDSSTVAGMLSEIQEGDCDAYAIGFDAKGYDEMPYARIAAKHFGIRLHEYYVTPDEVVQALPKVAAAFDEPFGNSSALPAYFCARMAAGDGIDVLLAGDGGDELFAGNARYAGQKIFEDYRRVPQWLRSGVVEPVIKNLPENLPLVSKGRSFLRQANTSLPERLQYYSFLEQNSPHDVFRPAFLMRADKTRPLKLLKNSYQLPGQLTVLNRMLLLDWQVTLADNDLRKVTQACALADVKVRYPMLDDELVEFSTSIPSAWKLPGSYARGRKLRHFYKKALTGWLPDATISKGKHGFGLPFGVWMKNHKPLQELACDNILKLKERGIFLPQFLDQAIASHRDGHAAYYGELIWVLTCLELWLAANQPDYRVD